MLNLLKTLIEIPSEYPNEGKIGQFLYNKTERRPMVLPVVIEV